MVLVSIPTLLERCYSQGRPLFSDNIHTMPAKSSPHLLTFPSRNIDNAVLQLSIKKGGLGITAICKIHVIKHKPQLSCFIDRPCWFLFRFFNQTKHA